MRNFVAGVTVVCILCVLLGMVINNPTLMVYALGLNYLSAIVYVTAEAYNKKKTEKEA